MNKLKQTRVMAGLFLTSILLATQVAFANCTSGTTGQGTLTLYKCDSGCTMFPSGPRWEYTSTCTSWYCCPGESTAYYYPSSCTPWTSTLGPDGELPCCRVTAGPGTTVPPFQESACATAAVGAEQ
ncbi:MAG: hypothetical protein NTU72_03020 [Fimbriimonadales bacterium]|nr:hypothetical protein [Fimbriimonadales bacterium]